MSIKSKHLQSSQSLHFKLLILGDCNVGKTALIRRICNDTFIENYISTAGIDFIEKKVIRDNKAITLQLWDTAGQERYKSIAKSLYNKANFILLLYSITDKMTYERISAWLKDIKANLQDTVPVVLIGNKKDMEENREVTEERGQILAEKNGIKFYETSARNGDNCEDVLDYAIEELLNRNDKSKDRTSNHGDNSINNWEGSFELDKNDKTKKCCS